MKHQLHKTTIQRMFYLSLPRIEEQWPQKMKKNADNVVFQQTLGAINEKLINEQRRNKENEFGNFVAMELSRIRDVLPLEAKQEITNIIFNYKRKWISQEEAKVQIGKRSNTEKKKQLKRIIVESDEESEEELKEDYLCDDDELDDTSDYDENDICLQQQEEEDKEEEQDVQEVLEEQEEQEEQKEEE
ncbi:hypothetical protein FQA39_LY08810 [Lamprigera yunnana]|nr:hypothetical protein FQA39_LY08810 [Lamprigera yunnana]